MTFDLNDEEEPRNAAAIRTALLMGAQFVHGSDVGGRFLPTSFKELWNIKGENVTGSKAHCAWMYLVVHGICIDKDAKPILCSEMPNPPED